MVERDTVAPAVAMRADRWRRRGSMAQDACLVVVSAYFFYVHARVLVADGRLTSLFFAVEQALLVGMFLSRRSSRATSSRVVDWVVATTGAWLVLVMRPVSEVGGTAMLFGTSLQALGLSLTCYGFWSLGRSFGIVAANRGLKQNGPYRVIRHPIYLSHSITLTGFLVANPSLFNAALFLVVSGSQLMRIRAEERVLRETGAYDAYAANVRWRLIPGLY